MRRRAEFVPYRPRTILNKHPRADHWFWVRYSAYPYLGCQHGCLFCYCRERKFCPHADPGDFAYTIRVKENAPELLRRALGRAPVDVIGLGDYQPAERRFRLSRRMLEVCLELGFPVLILTRSPLVLRDLDLLTDLNVRAPVVVAFSLIATPESAGYAGVRRMEHLAPALEKRWAAMAEVARAGLLTGACFMPILPGLCDDDANLELMVRWTAGHGGRFLLAGGLTLADQQRGFFFQALRAAFPELVEHYARLYPEGSYSAAGWPWPAIGRRLRALCQQAGLSDRMPRPVIPGEKRALNKRVVERLADQAYALELEEAPEARRWEVRRAAWAIEDLAQDLSLFYRTFGRRGLEGLPGMSAGLAGEVAEWLAAGVPPGERPGPGG